MDFRHILEKSNEEHHLLDVLTTLLENKPKRELKKKPTNQYIAFASFSHIYVVI